MDEQAAVGRRRARSAERSRWSRRALLVAALLALLAAVPFGWTQVMATDHLYDEASAPAADVVLVLGAQVAPGGADPMPVLRGRLDTAAGLVRSGRARVILVSGDATGGSGDETAVMTSYLTSHGVEPGRIVTDPAGLDTYDSCLRAREVFGVSRALVVTQAYHLARAVALCRHVGVDADGVAARCAGCRRVTLVRNGARDFLACAKAAWDAGSERRPAVESPADPAVTEALARG